MALYLVDGWKVLQAGLESIDAVQEKLKKVEDEEAKEVGITAWAEIDDLRCPR